MKIDERFTHFLRASCQLSWNFIHVFKTARKTLTQLSCWFDLGLKSIYLMLASKAAIFFPFRAAGPCFRSWSDI